MKHLILSSLLLSICTFQPAYSQSKVCAKRDKLVTELAKSHGETRQSIGLQRNSGVIEIFANIETGSWTILVSLLTGMSCLVAAGEAFSIDPVKSKGEQS